MSLKSLLSSLPLPIEMRESKIAKAHHLLNEAEKWAVIGDKEQESDRWELLAEHCKEMAGRKKPEPNFCIKCGASFSHCECEHIQEVVSSEPGMYRAMFRSRRDIKPVDLKYGDR